jgi:hypothetical protein
MLSIAAVSLRFWLIAVLSDARKPVTTMSGACASSLCGVCEGAAGEAACWAIAGLASPASISASVDTLLRT